MQKRSLPAYHFEAEGVRVLWLLLCGPRLRVLQVIEILRSLHVLFELVHALWCHFGTGISVVHGAPKFRIEGVGPFCHFWERRGASG